MTHCCWTRLRYRKIAGGGDPGRGHAQLFDEMDQILQVAQDRLPAVLEERQPERAFDRRRPGRADAGRYQPVRPWEATTRTRSSNLNRLTSDCATRDQPTSTMLSLVAGGSEPRIALSSGTSTMNGWPLSPYRPLTNCDSRGATGLREDARAVSGDGRRLEREIRSRASPRRTPGARERGRHQIITEVVVLFANNRAAHAALRLRELARVREGRVRRPHDRAVARREPTSGSVNVGRRNRAERRARAAGRGAAPSCAPTRGDILKRVPRPNYSGAGAARTFFASSAAGDARSPKSESAHSLGRGTSSSEHLRLGTRATGRGTRRRIILHEGRGRAQLRLLVDVEEAAPDLVALRVVACISQTVGSRDVPRRRGRAPTNSSSS